MRFLADVGVSRQVVAWLCAHTHDAVHLRDEQLQRLPDSDIFAKALAERRIILTFDLGFAEILALAGPHPGSAIIFRLVNTRSDHVMQRLQTVLEGAAQDLEDGAIISVEEHRYRVRLLPLGRERAP